MFISLGFLGGMGRVLDVGGLLSAERRSPRAAPHRTTHDALRADLNKVAGDLGRAAGDLAKAADRERRRPR
jgi:hypothetical protein